MGKFFIRCRIQLKFYIRVRLKRWNDRGEFEIDRANSKNYIAENSVALGHDTHNRILHLFRTPVLWKLLKYIADIRHDVSLVEKTIWLSLYLRGWLLSYWYAVVRDLITSIITDIIITVLLFISYKFVKGFLAITFLLLVCSKLKLSWCVSTFFI